jgi:glycosyltransferase involved in cell wall biosynthesis
MVRRGGLEHQITFKGFRNDVRAELEGLDGLAMPSLSEGLPFTLLEAMGLGLPVIASAVGGICDVVEDGVSGVLVPPGNTAALSAAGASVATWKCRS